MLERLPDSLDPEHQRQREKALLRSQSMGDAAPGGGQGGAQDSAAVAAPAAQIGELPLTNAELVQLHVRVIALENLVIALLAEGSERQLQTARDMSTYIAPRPGFTRHTLTVDAATQMVSLVDRARHFRGLPPA